MSECPARPDTAAPTRLAYNVRYPMPLQILSRRSSMSIPRTAPFGSWRSPITSDLIVAESISILDVLLDEETVYWLEGRPREGGRCVLVRRNPDGTTVDVNPSPVNVRTRVHEYGGGAAVVRNGTAYYTNFA